MAGASSLLHVPLAVSHAPVDAGTALVLLVMALVCLPCAGHLHRRGDRGAILLSTVMAAGMLAVHGVLLWSGHGSLRSAAGPPGSAHLHGTALGVGLGVAGSTFLAGLLVALGCVQVGWGVALSSRGTVVPGDGSAKAVR